MTCRKLDDAWLVYSSPHLRVSHSAAGRERQRVGVVLDLFAPSPEVGGFIDRGYGHFDHSFLMVNVELTTEELELINSPWIARHPLHLLS